MEWSGTVLTFAWNDRRKPQKMSVKIVVAPAEIQTGFVPDTSQKCYHISQLAQYTHSVKLCLRNRVSNLTVPLPFLECGVSSNISCFLVFPPKLSKSPCEYEVCTSISNISLMVWESDTAHYINISKLLDFNLNIEWESESSYQRSHWINRNFLVETQVFGKACIVLIWLASVSTWSKSRPRSSCCEFSAVFHVSRRTLNHLATFCVHRLCNAEWDVVGWIDKNVEGNGHDVDL
jgi:hypothetical protein